MVAKTDTSFQLMCLLGTANKVINGKDLHWEAFAKWLNIEEKDLECMYGCCHNSGNRCFLIKDN